MAYFLASPWMDQSNENDMDLSLTKKECIYLTIWANFSPWLVCPFDPNVLFELINSLVHNWTNQL